MGIDALKRFQVGDEMCKKFGYKKITKQDKAKIFGLNAAKLYKVDVKAKRNALPADAFKQTETGLSRSRRRTQQRRLRLGAIRRLDGVRREPLK